MDYHNNSSLEQGSKKVEPPHAVVKGKTSTVKKSFFKQMKEDLFVTDARTVLQSVKNNVLIPGIKKIFLDIVWNGIVTATYGSKPANMPNPSTYSNPSYNVYSTNTRNGYWQSQIQNAQNIPVQSGNLYNDILFSNSGDAQAVLNEMQMRIDAYGSVSVSDMYTLAGLDVPDNNWVLAKWCWTNIANSNVLPAPNGGYIINFSTKPRYM